MKRIWFEYTSAKFQFPGRFGFKLSADISIELLLITCNWYHNKKYHFTCAPENCSATDFCGYKWYFHTVLKMPCVFRKLTPKLLGLLLSYLVDLNTTYWWNIWDTTEKLQSIYVVRYPFLLTLLYKHMITPIKSSWLVLLWPNNCFSIERLKIV